MSDWMDGYVEEIFLFKLLQRFDNPNLAYLKEDGSVELPPKSVLVLPSSSASSRSNTQTIDRRLFSDIDWNDSSIDNSYSSNKTIDQSKTIFNDTSE
jgi:hypothetical protein